MKKFKIILLTFILSFSSVSEKNYFSNTSGEILEDFLIGFNYETQKQLLKEVENTIGDIFRFRQRIYSKME